MTPILHLVPAINPLLDPGFEYGRSVGTAKKGGAWTVENGRWNCSLTTGMKPSFGDGATSGNNPHRDKVHVRYRGTEQRGVTEVVRTSCNSPISSRRRRWCQRWSRAAVSVVAWAMVWIGPKKVNNHPEIQR